MIVSKTNQCIEMQVVWIGNVFIFFKEKKTKNDKKWKDMKQI